jgi:flagellar basal-body rod protein FlgC
MPESPRMTLFSLTERAMSAQMVRMNAATSNLANAGSIARSEGEA